MKKLAFVAMGIGDISLMIGLYVALVLAPNADAATSQVRDLPAPSDMDFAVARHATEAMVSTGEIGLLIGGIGLVVGVIAGLKSKWIVAWVAAGTGAVGALLNAAYATHMFS